MLLTWPPMLWDLTGWIFLILSSSLRGNPLSLLTGKCNTEKEAHPSKFAAYRRPFWKLDGVEEVNPFTGWDALDTNHFYSQV